MTKKGGKPYPDYVIGGPTLEMWVASWNQKHGNSERNTLYANGNSNDGNGYYVGITPDCTTDLYSVNTAVDENKLYFPHEGDDIPSLFEGKTLTPQEARCHGYWLSSPSAGDGSQLMTVKPSGQIGSCYYDKQFGVRPVICLESGVKLKKEERQYGAVVYYDIIRPE